MSAKLGMTVKEARKGKKVAVIVGFAPTSRHLAPYDNPDVDIWGINEAYFYSFMHDSEGHDRWDLWFQIHQPWSFTRLNNENHLEHWKWLKGEEIACRCTTKDDIDTAKCKQCGGTGKYKRDLTIPIVMQDVYDDVPNSVRFPYEEVISELLPDITRQVDDEIITIEYFTSSFAYMMSWAIIKGYERVEIYGFEMATETEYIYQKGSTEFWIGLAIGRGIEVYIPHKECKLMKAEKYGYDTEQMIGRQHLGFRLVQLTNQMEGAKGQLNMTAGKKQESMTAFEELRVEMGELQKEYSEAKSPGQKKRLEKQMKKLGVKLEKRRVRTEELFNAELRKVNELNSIGGAKGEIEAQIAHVDCQSPTPDPDEDGMVPKPLIIPNAELEVHGVKRQEEKKETPTPDGG